MTCQHCGGSVIWCGPLVALTHTKCTACGATDCQVPDEDPDAGEDDE